MRGVIDAGPHGIIAGRVDGTVCSTSAAGALAARDGPRGPDATCCRECDHDAEGADRERLDCDPDRRDQPTEAELIAGLLRSNGLRAAVSADDAAGLDPQLQLEGVRILVAPSDEAAARRILAAAEAAGP